MANRLGQLIDNYHLTLLIGQGDFAEVYLGEHVRHNNLVAIKVFHTQLSDTGTALFLNEMRAITGLKHPNILRVLDFDVENGIPYIIMDYFPKGTLRRLHLKGIRSLPTNILPYVKQIAGALQYAHERNLIHRDVKPENMLLDGNNEVLLSDFGLAVFEQGSRPIGTVEYIAPEQIKGKPCLASDQYALGIVIYEWLTGSPPFKGSYMEIINQHLSAAPPPLQERIPGFPPALEQVVLKALAKDPKGRFPSVDDFADALEHAIPSQPVIPTLAVSKPQGIPVSLPQDQFRSKLSRREFAKWGAVALVGVAAIVTVVELYTHSSIASSTPKPAVAPTTPKLGTTLNIYRDHHSDVTTVAWSPDSRRIASGSGDKYPDVDPTVRVWDWNATAGGLTYKQHTSEVKTVAWSPNGQYIASGSRDNTARVWNVTTGIDVPSSPYRGHQGAVRSVAWSSDSTRIASAGEDKTVQVWDVATGGKKFFLTYERHKDWVLGVAWSPDGTQIASASVDGTVQVWDANTGNHLFTYNGHNKQRVGTLAWSPNRMRIASGSWDKTVQIWDATTGNNIVTCEVHSEVNSMAWSPNGKYIASGSVDKKVHIFDVATGRNIYTYAEATNEVWAVAWSPDGIHIASGSNDFKVRVWQAL